MKKFNFVILFVSVILSSYVFVDNSNVILASTLKPDARTTLELGSLFKNHMVLQREQSIPIWGKAAIGATITVKFANSEKSTVVDTNGKWRLDLNALKASFEPETMIISSSENKEDIKISDIVVATGLAAIPIELWRYRRIRHPRRCRLLVPAEAAQGCRRLRRRRHQG